MKREVEQKLVEVKVGQEREQEWDSDDAYFNEK